MLGASADKSDEGPYSVGGNGMLFLYNQDRIVRFASSYVRALCLLVTLGAIGAARAEDPGFPAPTGDPSVLPADAKLDRVFDGGCTLTEGVATSPDGMVYFSDITFTQRCKDPSGQYAQAGNIWKYDPKTKQATIFRSPSGMSNGMKFDAQGNLIIAEGADFGGRRLTKTDMKTGKSYILTGLYNGQPYNALNDLTIDEKGRIYFTDPRYLGWEPMNQPVQAVYRLDPDGKVTRLITDAGKPNGIQVSPDQKTLYVLAHDNGAHDFLEKGETSEKGLMACVAYALGADGTVSNRRLLVNWLPNDGGDGMTIDEEGNLYIAVRSEAAPGLYVYPRVNSSPMSRPARSCRPMLRSAMAATRISSTSLRERASTPSVW
jgi:gluconolactonase